LSPLSSETQATGRLVLATHSLSRVVLPKPAGAEDEGELARHAFVQSFDQTRAWHQFGSDGGDMEFGPQ